MRWDISNPRHTRWLQLDARVQSARNSAVNDGLFLLIQQRNHFALCFDGSLKPPAYPVNSPSDRILFCTRWHDDLYT